MLEWAFDCVYDDQDVEKGMEVERVDMGVSMTWEAGIEEEMETVLA